MEAGPSLGLISCKSLMSGLRTAKLGDLLEKSLQIPEAVLWDLLNEVKALTPADLTREDNILVVSCGGSSRWCKFSIFTE